MAASAAAVCYERARGAWCGHASPTLAGTETRWASAARKRSPGARSRVRPGLSCAAQSSLYSAGRLRARPPRSPAPAAPAATRTAAPIVGPRCASAHSHASPCTRWLRRVPARTWPTGRPRRSRRPGMTSNRKRGTRPSTRKVACGAAGVCVHRAGSGGMQKG
eukprot:scaffold16168_cov110-Isochrysis_galbana.AAC.2